jgi:hypothetical protein
MIDLGIKLENKQILKQIEALGKNTWHGIERGLFFAGKNFREIIRKGIIAKDKTGRLYLIRRGRVRRRHRASAGGEYPANLSGRLRRSMGFEVTGLEKLEVGSRGVEYAKFLNEGTKKIKARPWGKKSFDSGKNEALKLIEKEIQKEVTK